MFETYVEVLLDQNLSKRLEYGVPAVWSSSIAVGMRVEVPLKNSLKKGTVVEIKQIPSFPSIRPIARILSDCPELTEGQWKLAHWMARYYAAPLQRVLKCFISPHLRQEVKARRRIFLSLGKTEEETLKAIEALRIESPEEADLLEAVLSRKQGCFATEVAQFSRTALKRLIQKKLLSSKSIPYDPELLLEEEFFKTKSKILNEEQDLCLKAICASLAEKRFAAHLIHGVTGSGKTEVYLQAIGAALAANKGAILLVPEISLTSQTIERFRARFSEKIAILHSKRSLGERSLAVEQLLKGEIRIAIGARSAVFAPMRDLGLIIVDEEHDSSYKQSEEAPFYNARNIAVMRAHLEQAIVVLGSATPSIESRYNAELGKYTFHLLSARAGPAPLPKVTVVDMKKTFDLHGGFTHFSDELLGGIKERLESGEQTLLFLNRRGYHRMQVCSSCRLTVKCPHCDLGLTYHRGQNHLRCHLCDFQREAPRQCPSCSSMGTLQFKGFGTEHAERALHAVFPAIRTLRMDRDTTQKKESCEEIFKQFRSHKADVLIGTQMIAKGFHFPAVTLVGVLNADAPLSIPDFRAPESTFQLLTQVAGRSGRSDLPGEVIFQTFLPDHPILKLAAAQDYSAFYLREIEERRFFGYPPFAHLVKCLFFSSDASEAEAAANQAREVLTRSLPPYAQALPVGPCGHPKIKDQYRFQFLIKTSRIEPLAPLLQSIQTEGVRIDIDPLSTFF